MRKLSLNNIHDHQSIVKRSLRQRLWWCPIGPLSSLPLHAAGIYEGSGQDHVGNYVVSSYTPTITALYRLLTETSGQTPNTVTPKMLLVAQPTSIGQSPLVNVEIEIDEITSLIPPEHIINVKNTQGVSSDDVLAGLNSANVLHLACHGHQDQNNPLNSGFELEDGRLTLGQIMRLNTPHAQLAYLSACDSAGMDETRPDEGLNLVGTMIFVGFRSVIGTMW
jgi:CHAT domain-containing protein